MLSWAKMSGPFSWNVLFQVLTVLGWIPYTLATCAAVLSPVSSPITTWNLSFAEYRFPLCASSVYDMIPHLPEEVKSTHYLLVQIFGVIPVRIGR
jgi:hypothetical protein